ncbi:hypothetical protein [Lentzea sp. NPDC059081]|uniref:hypothetical protein n=1 Tax=Lentzea sp. NPDC059081 TaxID=3346719 RepID=UPI0036B0369D
MTDVLMLGEHADIARVLRCRNRSARSTQSIEDVRSVSGAGAIRPLLDHVDLLIASDDRQGLHADLALPDLDLGSTVR